MQATDWLSVKPNYSRIAIFSAAAIVSLGLLAAYGIACTYLYLNPSLPTVEAMKSAELQVPLRVYTRSGTCSSALFIASTVGSDGFRNT